MPWSNLDIDRMFKPNVVAVVGARRADNYMWLRNMSDFRGKVYSVQIDPNDAAGIVEMGIPNYKSLVEIPEQVDYAVVAVPRRVAPIILKDAIAKRVRAVHMFTSGFAESGEDGVRLEGEITRMARDAGIIIVGPNCMGVFSPDAGMRTGADQDVSNTGFVSIVAQSGGHTNALVNALQGSGVGINKAISYGNAVVLDSPDLLTYFGDDPGTSVICAYVEGPKDGRAFFEALRYAACRKAVVLWKGGQTEAGTRAVASHTGALAGSMATWDAVARQTGALRVDSFEEAMDTVKALAYLPPPEGDGVAIIGGTGGQSVSMSDDFSRAGLRVPAFTGPTLDRMAAFFQLIGASYYNPVDVGGMNRRHMASIVDLMAADTGIHTVAFLVGGVATRRSQDENLAEFRLFQNAAAGARKPVLAMFHAPIPYRDGARLEDLDRMLQGLGIPVFPDASRAARALRRVVDFYRRRSGGADIWNGDNRPLQQQAAAAAVDLAGDPLR